MATFTTLSQLNTVATAIANKADDRYLKQSDVDSYTITKQAEAEDGYSATYQLFKGETAVGAKINIPKDMVVSGGEVKTVSTAGEPYSGAVVGEKYIELTIANATNDKLYIPVNDLVDIYTAGNGLSLSSGAFTVVVDSTSSNGLSVSASGVALALASTTDAGAMSASDKSKLDNADVTAYTEGNGIDIDEHAISAVVDTTNANGLSVGSDGIALAAATTSSAGAMSASDKTKLDGITEATATEIQNLVDGLWAS